MAEQQGGPTSPRREANTSPLRLVSKRTDILERQPGDGDGGRGGGEGGDGEMEYRVATLEKAVDKIDGKLDRLLDGVGEIRTALARVEERLEGKANSSEVTEIKGRVSALPTTLQLILLVFAILGGAFAIVRFGISHTP